MKYINYLIVGALILAILSGCNSQKKHQPETDDSTIRFATFNVSMFRESGGELIKDLSTTDNNQISSIAEIIQIVRPEVLALMEFDYDKKGKALDLFQANYLSISQNGEDPIYYRYKKPFSSNTGIPTGFDLDNDGKVEGANDAFGYGKYEGQYAFALLSMYPISEKNVRTFQRFLWKDMPNANWPVNEDGSMFYSKDERDVFRLSSKNHVIAPVEVPGGIIHVILAHPTPPVFDGVEDKNGKRNYDEIRLLADIIGDSTQSDYLYDDEGIKGGITSDYFVIMGDLNADPADGDSYDRAIFQLLQNQRIHREARFGVHVPSSKGSHENSLANPGKNSKGNPWYDTSVWGLRIDYILPSTSLEIEKSGMFWPPKDHTKYYLIENNASSDHRLIWMDIHILNDEL